MKRVIWLTALGMLAACSLASAQTPPPSNKPTAVPAPTGKDEQYSFALSASLWKFPANKPKLMFVCWENPRPAYADAMKIVQASVENTWQRHSGLQFRGWDRTCTNGMPGIHIKIADETGSPGEWERVQAETKNLGNKIDRVTNGMQLNVTFKTWGPTCAQTFGLEACIRSVAVHEFGHALGFSHEHHRADRSGECGKAVQGPNGDLPLTPYDPGSVMNYCNPRWNNNGELTALDIMGLQKAYCSPDKPLCEPDLRGAKMMN